MIRCLSDVGLKREWNLSFSAKGCVLHQNGQQYACPAFQAATPEGRCPVEYRGYLSVHMYVRPYPRAPKPGPPGPPGQGLRPRATDHGSQDRAPEVAVVGITVHGK